MRASLFSLDAAGGWIRYCDLAARCARSYAICDALSKAEGAGKAGCPRHPQSCARMHMTDRRCAGTPGLPCAVVLTAYAALSPEPNSSCLRRRRIGDRSKARSGPTHLHQLDTSNGCQDHTVLPSAASLSQAPRPGACAAGRSFPRGRLSAVRLRAVIAHGRTALRPHRAPDAAASTATCPNVRDDGQRPSGGTGWREL